MTRSTLLHLRIPFSFNLLPVFLFALCIDPGGIDIVNGFVLFFALHLFIYPASNGYNSYFDKDEESIGGLKTPPKVGKDLYWTALLFDLIGTLICFLINWQVVTMVLIYGLISKAYSHPSIRLKKMPITGWVAVSVFQGYWIFLTTYIAAHPEAMDLFIPMIQFPAILSTVMLFGSYPMTQIYQHEEDSRRGDQTISRKLGILGTFHFTMSVFTLATTGYFVYFYQQFSFHWAITYLVVLCPVLIYFVQWYLKARKDRAEVNFRRTMNLNLISATCLNLYFLAALVLR